MVPHLQITFKDRNYRGKQKFRPLLLRQLLKPFISYYGILLIIHEQFYL